MKINKSETTVMVCGVKEQAKIWEKIGDQMLQEIKEFSYFGREKRKLEYVPGRYGFRPIIMAINQQKTFLISNNIAVKIRKQF